MRTTLDIDDDVLQAAKELAKAEKKTAGQVLSELARKALTGVPASGEGEVGARFEFRDGWYVLPHRGGVIVTKELVDRLIEEADLEDARFSLPQRKQGE
jgi:hypothetical protein